METFQKDILQHNRLRLYYSLYFLLMNQILIQKPEEIEEIVKFSLFMGFPQNNTSIFTYESNIKQ